MHLQLQLEVMQKLNVLGGTFSDSDTVSVLSNACPSMVASKNFSYICTLNHNSFCWSPARVVLSYTIFSRSLNLMTLHVLPFLNLFIRFGHIQLRIFTKVNISNCAKINITIVCPKDRYFMVFEA